MAARPVRRPLQLRGHLLVRASRRLGQVPGPPVRISLRIGDRGQRLVRAAPRRGQGGVVRRRPDQRMAEPHPRLPGHQPLHSRSLARLRIDPQVPGRIPDQRGLSGRVGRRQQQQRLCAAGQRPHPGLVQLLQTAPESQRPIQRLRTRQLGGGQLPGQLDQRQRVTRGVGRDAPTHLPINLRARRRRQQLP
jgi:hypothetical protein